MKTQLTIGTRGSELALRQTEIVRRSLLTAYPDLEVKVQIIKTEGDLNLAPIPVDTIGKGWFTKEIEDALLAHEIDIAVHSLKDVADGAPGLCLDAFLEREDARDVLVTKHGESFELLKKGAVIGTDSIRRQVQIQALRPDAVVESIRGNVPTRLQKLMDETYDAIILAAAGLIRLGREDSIAHYFTIEEITPAPGQGILAVQVREDNTEVRTLLQKINDAQVAHIAHIERSFSHAVDGGCKSPVGCYASKDGEECVLVGMMEEMTGEIIREEIRAPWNESAALGENLAQKLLALQKYE